MAAKLKNILPIIVIAAVVLFYILSGGSIGISLDFGEDTLTISAENYDHIVAYENIERLELASLPEPGSLIDGIDKKNLRCGSWENSQFGRYHQFVVPNVSECILIRLQDGEVLILNYQDSESTLALHKMFSDLLLSKDFLSQS